MGVSSECENISAVIWIMILRMVSSELIRIEASIQVRVVKNS